MPLPPLPFLDLSCVCVRAWVRGCAHELSCEDYGRALMQCSRNDFFFLYSLKSRFLVEIILWVCQAFWELERLYNPLPTESLLYSNSRDAGTEEEGEEANVMMKKHFMKPYPFSGFLFFSFLSFSIKIAVVHLFLWNFSFFSFFIIILKSC